MGNYGIRGWFGEAPNLLLGSDISVILWRTVPTQFGQHCVGSVQRKRREGHVLVELQLSIFGETVSSGLLSPSTSESPTPFTRLHRSHCTAHSDFTKMHNCPDKTHVIWAHLHILFSHCPVTLSV